MFWTKKYKQRKSIKELTHHIKSRAHIDDDILSEKKKQKLSELCSYVGKIVPDSTKSAEQLNVAWDRSRELLPVGRYHIFREYADVLAVAIVVAFGIRALFLQPFKIPTSSMQPTLFGIHYISDQNETLKRTPSLLEYPLFSARRAELTVKASGYIDQSSIRYFSRYMLADYTSFNIDDISYTLPGTPSKVLSYLHFKQQSPGPIEKGTQLCNGWLSLGDHLFVDRFSMQLFGINRGDITVFNTEGIIGSSGNKLAGFYYIKRLAGMPGDTLRITDNMLYVKTRTSDKFMPITELDERFKKIYSGQGGYHGHHNGFSNGDSATYLGKNHETLTVPEDHYFMLGDNSLSSADSRDWGLVPRRNIVGKASFIFWPFSRRWGRVDHTDPLPVKTGQFKAPHGFKAMEMQ
jgi:signal peptidase I